MISRVLTPDTLAVLFNDAINAIQQNVKSISLLTGIDYTDSKRLPSNIFSENAFPMDLYEKYNVEVRERHIYNYESGTCININMFPVHIDITIQI